MTQYSGYGHMRGRLRRYLPFLGWILGASLIPPTVFLSISYYEYVNSARTSLKVAVEAGARRIDTVLRTGNEILMRIHGEGKHYET